MKALLHIAGFSLYLWIIFLNAMTDLGHKIILQNTIFKATSGSEMIMLTAIVNALILLPFIFLFSPAGWLSDRFKKTKVIEYAALFAIGITLLITLSYAMGWFWFAFALTFVLAAQSALYSPAKYGLIKEMVGATNLASANAIVQAITIVAILLGALIYSLLFEALYAPASEMDQIIRAMWPLGLILVAASSVEYLLARKLVSRVRAQEDHTKSFSIDAYKKLSYLKTNLKTIRQNKGVWLSILGLSLLWGISQVTVAIFGQYLKDEVGITNTAVTQGLLALSGVGMIVGAISVSKLSKGYIETGIVPIGAAGVTAMLFLIPTVEHVRLLGIMLFAFGYFAALIMVPLNALIQFLTPIERLGTVLAGNNFMQNLFMLAFLVITALFALFQLDAKVLFFLSALIAAAGFAYTLVLLAHPLARLAAKLLISFRYSLQVEGLGQIESLIGKKGVLLLGNHISFLDWAILQMAYPKQIRFVMDRIYYDKWYLKPIFNFFGVIPISTRGSKQAIAAISEALKAGDTVALFPEGHITRNGHLSDFKSGFERATALLEDDDAVIVPFYLRGLWEDRFSYASKKLRKSGTKDIAVDFGKPLPIHTKAHETKQAVFHLSIHSWQRYATTLPSIQEAWFNRLPDAPIALYASDSTGAELTKKRFAVATLAIAGALKKSLKDEDRIGIIMPTSVGGAMVNMALLTLGKSVVNLNYTAGTEALKHALKTAKISHIVTSKQFLTRIKAKGFDLSEVLEGVELYIIEEIKQRLSKPKLFGYFATLTLLPHTLAKKCFIAHRTSSDEAAVLFSSGSEGKPKAIVLTHQNIMGNIKQITTVLNPSDEDRILSTLPIFHSFGLTVTTLLPLIEDIPFVAHPDPTDGYGIGKMCAKYQATMLCATATFLRLYARNKKLHPVMFETLRFVIAGAEKLPTEIRELFKKRFGKEVYEGYGATETTPVATVNLPDRILIDDWRIQKGNKPGTVGLPVPGSAIRIVDPESFEPLAVGEEGMVLIGGTQIMKGYLGDEAKTKEVIKKIDGIRWYVTGDKGKLDEDGFLTLLGRFSRFAKIGGEMVSFGVVEEAIATVLDEDEKIVITSVDDAKKGEAIVLLYEGSGEIDALKARIKTIDLNPLYMPTYLYKVEAIPVLGTGKVDIKGAKRVAQSLCNAKK